MAVVFDAKATAWSSVNAASLTITTLTVGSNSNRALLIELFCGSQGTTFPSGLVITRDTGESLSSGTIFLVPNTSFADANMTASGAMYALLNPTAGNHTITISWTGSNEMHAYARSYSGVGQTGGSTSFPNGLTVVHGTATASPVSTGAITSAVGDLVAAGFMQGAGNFSAPSGVGVGVLDNATGPNLAVAENYDTGAATVTMTAAFANGPATWAAVATDIHAAATGGGPLGAPNIRFGIPRLPLKNARAPVIQGTIIPPPPSGTPTLVQATGSTVNDQNGLTGNAFQFNMPNVTLSGNCVVLTIAYPYSATRTVSIVDSAGDTWPSPLLFGTASTGNMRVAIYVLQNAGAALHSLTVTFDTALRPFQYTMAEFYNVAQTFATDGSIGANSVSGSSANAGSFTPTSNNNASGGHLIFQYAISNDTVGTLFANEASAITTTNSAQLLHADNTATIPSASGYFVQATNGAVNPGFAFTQTMGTNFVVAAVALKAQAAGTAPAAGIRIVRLLHCTQNSPPTGNDKFLFPCDGNLRVATLAANNSLNVINSVKDSNNSTGYTDRTFASGDSMVFESINQSANNTNAITFNLNASEPQYSVHLWDIIGADPAPFMNSSGFNGAAPSSGTVFNNFPNHTPNANVAGLTIAQTGMGTAGPQFGFASGAPAGAVFDVVFYTGMTDADRMDNADPFGHVNFSTNTAQTWNWLLGSAGFGSTAFATAVSYKAAAPGTSVTVDFGGPLEFAGGLQTDALIVLEYLAGIRADSVTQIEAIAAVRGDNAGLPELLEGLSANVVSQLEFLGSMRGDNLGPLETASAFRSDIIVLMETLVGTRANMIAASEIVASLRTDLVGPIENQGTIGVTGNSALQIELTDAFKSDASSPNEALAAVRSDTTAPAELTAAVIPQSAVPAEKLSGVQGNMPVQAESQGGVGVTGDGALQLETTAAFRSDNTLWNETATAARLDVSGALESITGVLTQSAIRTENISGIQGNLSVQPENLGGIGVTGNAALQLDIIAAFRADASLWMDSIVAIRSDAPAPAEKLSGVQSNVALRIENLGGIAVTGNGMLQVEMTAAFKYGASFAAEIFAISAAGIFARLDVHGAMSIEEFNELAARTT